MYPPEPGPRTCRIAPTGGDPTEPPARIRQGSGRRTQGRRGSREYPLTSKLTSLVMGMTPSYGCAIDLDATRSVDDTGTHFYCRVAVRPIADRTSGTDPLLPLHLLHLLHLLRKPTYWLSSVGLLLAAGALAVCSGNAIAVALVLRSKTIVFFAAVLPQFVDREQGRVTGQMLLLGLVSNLIAVVCDSAWGMVAATARTWFSRSPQRLSAIGGAGGLAMIGLGVTVAATGRKD